jgi:hypothetical protein
VHKTIYFIFLSRSIAGIPCFSSSKHDEKTLEGLIQNLRLAACISYVLIIMKHSQEWPTAGVANNQLTGTRQFSTNSHFQIHGACTLRVCSNCASAAAVFSSNTAVYLSSAARRAASPPPADSRHRKSVMDTVLRLRAGTIFAVVERGRLSTSCRSSALSAALLAVTGNSVSNRKQIQSRAFVHIPEAIHHNMIVLCIDCCHGWQQ